MDRQSKVNDFVITLEGVSSSVMSKSLEISSKHLDNLENSITQYINTNYPSIVFTKDELKKLIENVYQDRHLNLKKSIDKNIGLMKYNLEGEDVDVDRIIDEEINKYKTLFTSISAGTNINYLGLVDECRQNVMAMLIRKNKSISFAKRTEEVSEYIYKLINDSFFSNMDELGNHFMSDVITPMEEQFKNEELNELLKQDTSEKNLHEKMESDKILEEYKQDIVYATQGLKNNEDKYIAGAIIIKHNNKASILIAGVDKNYNYLNPNYYLHHQIIERYKNDFEILDINGVADDFSQESKFYGLNKFKMGFNSKIVEYIGELDLVINNWKFKILEKNNLLSNEFTKKKDITAKK